MMACNKARSYEGAKAGCAQVGARLCSKEELLGNCAEGSGCNLDKSLVWTEDPSELKIFKPGRIEAGGYHSCAMDKVGGLFCWGNNRYGQLGNGETSEHPTIVPTQVKIDGKVQTVELGLRFSCLLDAQSDIRCWGSNSHGQLGDTVDKNVPTKVDLKNAGAVGFLHLGLGGTHACIIDNNYKLFCWGSNEFGQIGNGVTSSEPTLPTEIHTGNIIQKIRLGEHHSCAIDGVLQLLCWGKNSYGQVGIGNISQQTVPTPTKIDLGKPKDKIARENGESILVSEFVLGMDHTCIIDNFSAVSCWGRNDFGQLGTGTTSNAFKPTAVKGLGFSHKENGHYVDSFSLTSNAKSHSTCITNSMKEEVLCWGSGKFARFGMGEENGNLLQPTEMKFDEGWLNLSMGYSHSCLVDGSLEARCWGSNGSGQLGIGGVSLMSTPSVVDFSPSEEEIDHIASLIAEELPDQDEDVELPTATTTTASGTDEL